MSRYQPGDRVVVRRAYPPGHIRTPFYVRGRRGVIERLCGRYPSPEELAYGRSGLPTLELYRVRFPGNELWPDLDEAATMTVDVEVYENWLAPDDQGEKP